MQRSKREATLYISIHFHPRHVWFFFAFHSSFLKPWLDVRRTMDRLCSFHFLSLARSLYDCNVSSSFFFLQVEWAHVNRVMLAAGITWFIFRNIILFAAKAFSTDSYPLAVCIVTYHGGVTEIRCLCALTFQFTFLPFASVACCFCSHSGEQKIYSQFSAGNARCRVQPFIILHKHIKCRWRERAHKKKTRKKDERGL